jgi:hypothetical protein
LFIPSGSSDSGSRVTTEMSKEFDKMLEIIHKTIGCTDVPRKPELSYTMKQIPRPGLQLDSIEDWEGFKEHVRSVFGQKDEVVNVKILVSKEVSHCVPSLLSIFILPVV